MAHPSTGLAAYRACEEAFHIPASQSVKLGAMGKHLDRRIQPVSVVLAAALLCGVAAYGQESGATRAGAQGKIREPDKLVGVIALGGTNERIREAGRLARQYPHLRVIVSGAETAPSLQRLGPNIDRKRIEIETASRNTHENAVNTTRLVKPRRGDRWLLITSAWHMRRALCAFRTAGFDVEPWPVADRAMGQKRRDFYVSRERWALAAYTVVGWCKE
jgi:uncharacterized SAM-binding protein YcdF (DUF218 family)